MVAKKKATGEQTFRAARERLDAILVELESDAGDVDQLAARVREASDLIRFCRERLAGARQEVTEVVAALSADVSRQDDDDDDDENEGDEEDDEDDPAGGTAGVSAEDDLPF